MLDVKKTLSKIVNWIKYPIIDWANEPNGGRTFSVKSENDKYVTFGFASDNTNHGVWSNQLGKWLIHGDASKVYVNGNIPFNVNTVLWSGAWWMGDNQEIDLPQNVTDQTNGIVLAWSGYADDTAQNYDWCFTYVPKKHVQTYNGGGVCIFMVTSTCGIAGTKYIYVANNHIRGHSINTSNGTGACGIKYTNKHWVLRYVYGV